MADMKNSLKVKIPTGYLIVEAKGTEDEYPGVYISFTKDDKGTDLDQVACVEYDTSKEVIQTISYKEQCDEPCSISEYQYKYKLTERGRKKCADYIRELEAKRKEILDAGLDTADDTTIPDIETIFEDALSFGIDEDGLIVNGWGVTDNYDADYPIGLQLGEDFTAE